MAAQLRRRGYAVNNCAMRGRVSGVLSVLAVAGVSGCTSISSNYKGAMTVPSASTIYVCHGFDCTYKTRLDLGASDADRFASIMAPATTSPAAERAAVSKAVQYYEERAGQVIGLRDAPKSHIGQSRERGQMDCIDESTNTRSLLRYLNERQLLTHHSVEYNVSRGLFVDGRYPHSTAVLRDKSGKKWAVDSWYEPMGGPPDIMTLSEWQTRGVMGQR
ncbi:MAG: hypothetical protein AB7I79_10140 [Rhizobiaceae bacterium]